MKNKLIVYAGMISLFLWFWNSKTPSASQPKHTNHPIRSVPEKPKKGLQPGEALRTQGQPEFWPPVSGKIFPDLPLVNAQGQKTTLLKLLATLGAKAILIEPAAMTCAGCHAFAGAHEKGKFRDVAAQSDLKSIDHYFREFGHEDIRREGMVLVQLLLYSSSMGAPSLQDAQDWASHFEMGLGNRHVVIAAASEYQNPDSYGMVPGFFLLNSAFQVLKHSVGHQPKDNIYTELIPKAAALLREH